MKPESKLKNFVMTALLFSALSIGFVKVMGAATVSAAEVHAVLTK